MLRYLEQLYVNHAPEFIYFKTLFHVFERFLSGQADDVQLFERTAIVDTDMAITIAFDVYGTLIDTHGVIVALEKHVG